MSGDEPTLWLGGRFAGAPAADALYTEHGRIVAIGPEASVRRSAPAGVHRVDLRGHLVIPGLIDAHVHPGESVRAHLTVDLSGARSIEEILLRLDERRRFHSGALLGFGWDQEMLEEGRMPTRADLDRLAYDQPVVIYRRCTHVATLNSAALSAARLSNDVPDPPGGRFGREAGELDGRLFDAALHALEGPSQHWFPVSVDQMREWFAEAASMGITSLGAMSVDVAELHLLHAALRRGPKVSVHAYLRASLADRFVELRGNPTHDGPLELAGLKVIGDGSLGARTAWLSRPYSDDPSTSGAPVFPIDALPDLLAKAARMRARLAIHTIGDRTLAEVLETVEKGPRHGPVRVEHAAIAPASLIAKLAELAIPAVVQPSFVTSDTWIPERLGPARAPTVYPFREMLTAGVTLAGSSDAPIESRDPWIGMAAAVAGRPSYSAGQELSPDEALAMYTRSAAVALGVPHGGVLAAGAPADLVVLSAREWPEALARGRDCVLATFRGGVETYRAPSSRSGAEGL